jgi:hypothetical protein
LGNTHQWLGANLVRETPSPAVRAQREDRPYEASSPGKPREGSDTGARPAGRVVRKGISNNAELHSDVWRIVASGAVQTIRLPGVLKKTHARDAESSVARTASMRWFTPCELLPTGSIAAAPAALPFTTHARALGLQSEGRLGLPPSQSPPRCRDALPVSNPYLSPP